MKVLGINDLFDPQNIIENKSLLSPFLSTHRTIHLYAPGGVGKTYFSLMLAHALATGQGFLTWENTLGEPVTVLYLDGEMGKLDLRDRLALIEGGSPRQAQHTDLQFITYEDFDDQIFPNLADPSVQNVFNLVVDKVNPQVIIIDNLDTVTDKVEASDTETEIFKYIRVWANRQKAKGRAIVLVDHANKAGEDVYGTSKKQNACDVMIQLRKPMFQRWGCTAQNYYELHYRKGRQQLDSEKRPLWIEQHSTESTTELSYQSLDKVRIGFIKTLSKPRPVVIAQMLGVSTGKATQLIEEAKKFTPIEPEDLNIKDEDFDDELF